MLLLSILALAPTSAFGADEFTAYHSPLRTKLGVTAAPWSIAEAPIPATMSAHIELVRNGFVASPAAKECLAKAIYFEARGESRRGQAAVAQVILNRVVSGVYPTTICGVVYQNAHRRNACQFSFACDGIPDRIRERKAWRVAKAVAADVLKGKSRAPELVAATHYHANYVSPYWAPKMKRLIKIGNHIFYNA